MDTEDAFEPHFFPRMADCEILRCSQVRDTTGETVCRTWCDGSENELLQGPNKFCTSARSRKRR